MPCPHFSSVSGECSLDQSRVEDDDDAPFEAGAEDPVNREWCLGAGKKYRDCPVFRRFLAEFTP